MIRGILFLSASLVGIAATLPGPAATSTAQPASGNHELVIVYDAADVGNHRGSIRVDSDGSAAWVPSTATVYALDGTVVSGLTEPIPPTGTTPIDQVRANFAAAGKSDEFEKQLGLLVTSMVIPSGLTVEAANAFLQGTLTVAYGNFAEHWEPWLTPLLNQLTAPGITLADYIAIVDAARESLQ